MAKLTTAPAIAKKITLISVFAVGLALIVSAIAMFSSHSSEILERSYTEARSNSINLITETENVIDSYSTECALEASRLSEATSTEEVKSLLSQIYVGKLKYGVKNEEDEENDIQYGLEFIKYFLKETIGDVTTDYAYSMECALLGTENDLPDLAFDYRKNKATEVCYLGTNLNFMEDRDPEKGTIQVSEFYIPIQGSDYIDGVSLYFSLNVVRSRLEECFLNDDAVVSTVCNRDGVVLAGLQTVELMSIYDDIQARIGNTDPIKRMQNMLDSGESGTIPCKISGDNYVISIQINSDSLSDLAVVELYECSSLAKSTVDLIDAIIAVIVIVVIILVGVAVYFVYNQVKLQRKVNNAESYDLNLDCLNKHGFEKEADQILSRNTNLYYAAIICQIRHFKFLYETYGESEINQLLTYLKVVFNKTCKIEEIYGYKGEGEFLIFLHAKDREDLISRLKIHSFLSSQYKGNNKFDVALKYGIYEHVEDEKISVSKMLDFANEANNAIVKSTVENVDMQFNFYDINLKKIRVLNENMELRQETALKEGEFQVFYQAKYNLNTHKQDGAEALVRWYDPKTGEYNKPYLFMPLFESNGFIEKLDKYVYTKVCEYISYSLASGRNVFPVSVNVSRITATQPDFVDFYAKTKKKYGIANGALTIEFTESFAYENYDVLKDIVDKLHKYGFKTSIDDFGCGYSSYRILKELPMDEIKLDKFFIDRAEDPERVDFIFESVISLAKNLKMKVTQEGVERQEDVELLKAHGCDVIQGYIYSHPLSLTDYLAFVEHTKDHNL